MLMYMCENEYERRLAEDAANVETVAVDVEEISGQADGDPWLQFMHGGVVLDDNQWF